jgi:hypothetical protein
MALNLSHPAPPVGGGHHSGQRDASGDCAKIKQLQKERAMGHPLSPACSWTK